MAEVMSISWREERLRYVFHIVVPNKKMDSVIGEVLPNGDLRLPRIDLPASIEYPSIDKIERCVETELNICGYNTKSLFNGCNRRVEGEEGTEEHEVLLFEVIDDQVVLQKPFEWISRKAAWEGKWMPTNGEENDEHVNEVLDGMFTIINEEVEEEAMREPWETMGWYEELMSWTREVLESRNMMMVGRIYQIHRMLNSIVLSCEVKMRQNTEAMGRKKACDVVFIKASVPSIREAQRTVTIRNVIGNIVPEIIGTDETRGIMIQRNGGKVTDAPWDQESLIKTILRMQSLSLNRISELEAGGLLVADCRWIESNAEFIVHHELLDECWKRTGNEEEKEMRKRVVEGLRSAVDMFHECCRTISSLGLPNTLVHGDLHMCNIGRPLKEEGTTYHLFDWAESFIGNPILDFKGLLSDTFPDFPGYYIDNKACIRQVYEYWKPRATLEEMEEVLEHALILSEIIIVYQYTKQYDACGEFESERKSRVVHLMQDIMEHLSMTSEI